MRISEHLKDQFIDPQTGRRYTSAEREAMRTKEKHAKQAAEQEAREAARHAPPVEQAPALSSYAREKLRRGQETSRKEARFYAEQEARQRSFEAGTRNASAYRLQIADANFEQLSPKYRAMLERNAAAREAELEAADLEAARIEALHANPEYDLATKSIEGLITLAKNNLAGHKLDRALETLGSCTGYLEQGDFSTLWSTFDDLRASVVLPAMNEKIAAMRSQTEESTAALSELQVQVTGLLKSGNRDLTKPNALEQE